MRYCAALNCSNGSKSEANRNYVKENNVTFHGFPMSDKKRLKVWVDRVGRKGLIPTQYSCLCSEHFREEDFTFQPFTNMRLLKKTAIPSRFSLTKAPDGEKRRKTTYQFGASVIIPVGRFPMSQPELLGKWVTSSKKDQPDLSPKNSSVLCSVHFAESYFDRTGQTIKLTEDAEPTIFEYSKDWQPESQSDKCCSTCCQTKKWLRMTRKRKATANETGSSRASMAYKSVNPVQCGKTHSNQTPNRRTGLFLSGDDLSSQAAKPSAVDETYHAGSPIDLSKKCIHVLDEVEVRQKRVRVEQETACNLKNKVTHLSKVIDKIKEQKLVSGAN